MNRFLLLCGLGLLLSGTACNNADSFPEVPAQKRTNIRLFNGYFRSPVDVRLNTFGGEVRFLVNRLTYAHSWPEGGYADLLTRRGDVETSGADSIALDVVAYNIDTFLIEKYPENLPPETFASFYVVDSIGKPVMVKTSDDFIRPGAGQATYRFINLYPQLNSVSFESSLDTLGFDRFTFLNYSSFASVSSGVRTMRVINDSSGGTIATLEDVDLLSGGVYVFYLLNRNGIPEFNYERVY
jgi:hypothetical protein